MRLGGKILNQDALRCPFDSAKGTAQGTGYGDGPRSICHWKVPNTVGANCIRPPYTVMK